MHQEQNLFFERSFKEVVFSGYGTGLLPVICPCNPVKLFNLFMSGFSCVTLKGLFSSKNPGFFNDKPLTEICSTERRDESWLGVLVFL